MKLCWKARTIFHIQYFISAFRHARKKCKINAIKAARSFYVMFRWKMNFRVISVGGGGGKSWSEKWGLMINVKGWIFIIFCSKLFHSCSRCRRGTQKITVEENSFHFHLSLMCVRKKGEKSLNEKIMIMIFCFFTSDSKHSENWVKNENRRDEKLARQIKWHLNGDDCGSCWKV